jgi:hypothetical protein
MGLVGGVPIDRGTGPETLPYTQNQGNKATTTTGGVFRETPTANGMA